MLFLINNFLNSVNLCFGARTEKEVSNKLNIICMKYILYNSTTVCTWLAHVFESFALESLRFLAIHLIYFNEINSLID